VRAPSSSDVRSGAIVSAADRASLLELVARLGDDARVLGKSGVDVHRLNNTIGALQILFQAILGEADVRPGLVTARQERNAGAHGQGSARSRGRGGPTRQLIGPPCLEDRERGSRVAAIRREGDDAPLPYLAMDRLEGKDLEHILRRKERLSLAEVVDLARQVGRAAFARRGWRKAPGGRASSSPRIRSAPHGGVPAPSLESAPCVASAVVHDGTFASAIEPKRLTVPAGHGRRRRAGSHCTSRGSR